MAAEELPFSKGEKKLLYGRFHGLRNKAKAKGIPFAWESYEEFQKDVLELAPAEYLPSRYRMEFDAEALSPSEIGYCKETMSILPIKRLLREERLASTSKVMPGACRNDCLLVAVLAQELMKVRGEEMGLEEVWEEAKLKAAQ